MSKRTKKIVPLHTQEDYEIPDPDMAIASLPPLQSVGPTRANGHRIGSTPIRPSPIVAGRNRWAARVESANSKKKAMLSDHVPEEFKQFADDLQLRSETGLVLLFTDCVVTQYWTQFPNSLTILVNVSEEQFGEEIRSQYGELVYETLFHSDAVLPLNFPFAASTDVPNGCMCLKFKISQDKIEAFREQEDATMSQGFRPKAVCDLIIIPTCYPPFGDQPRPGVSFKVARVTLRD